jgi:hypothetical protein
VGQEGRALCYPEPVTHLNTYDGFNILLAVIVVLAIVVLSIPEWLRIRSMRKLAAEFGLMYRGKSTYFWSPFRSGWDKSRKVHFMNGVYRGHAVEIYDLDTGQRFAAYSNTTHVTRNTVLTVDGKGISLSNKLDKQVSVKIVRDYLLSL